MPQSPTAPALRRRGLLDIAADADALSPASRVHHATSLAPAQVTLPAMPIGQTFLERWPIREGPGTASWRDSSYECIAPATFVLRDVLVHSSAGIIAVGGDVIGESLAHTAPDRQHYTASLAGITLAPRTPRRLPGTHITILAGARGNYFHATMESTMRLAMLSPYHLAVATGLLHPAGAVAQDRMIDLAALPRHIARHAITDDETLLIDTLIFPWTVHGLSSYHPCVLDFFGRISTSVAEHGTDFPVRILIDRQGAAQRPLLNEAALAGRLAPLGFVPVRPETLTLEDQIRLFRNAEAIVAPHGAALTNIGFCRPGCIVLELQMDAYVNWCFRTLAALRGLRYDCVLGQATPPWTDQPHALSWTISTDHVTAAIAHLLQD